MLKPFCLLTLWTTVATGAGARGILGDTVLPWLPANTEALLVSNTPFVLGRTMPQNDPRQDYAEIAALGLLPAQISDSFPEPMRGLGVESAAYAARRVRAIPGKIGLGVVASMEGCSVLRLSVSASKLVAERLASLPTEQVGRDRVTRLVTPTTEQGDPERAVYFAAPDPETVMACSDRGFLLEVLGRKRRNAKRVALLASLSEWKWVDRTAAVWGLRHFSNSDRSPDPSSPHDPSSYFGYDPGAVGLTFCFTLKSSVKVHYLSADAAAGAYLKGLQKGDVNLSRPSRGVFSLDCEVGRDPDQLILLELKMRLFGFVSLI